MSSGDPAERQQPTADRPHALLLDLDGTLVDSEPIHRAGFERWFAHRGWAFDREVASLFTGRRADDVFRTVDGPWSGGDPTEMFHEIVAMVPRDRLPDAVPGAVASIERALACEDAPQGVVAAVAAGVGHVVGVTTSFSQEVLRDAGAHATMPDLTGIPTLLAR